MKNIYSLLCVLAVMLIILEMAFAFFTKKKVYDFSESIINLGTGLINQCMNLLIFAGVMKTYGFLYDRFALWSPEKNGLYYLTLLVLIDFLFYWYHRWNHERNFLWAAHSPHHSAEDFNFTVAARASLTQRLFSFTMYWPLTFLGFEPFDIYTMTGIHLIIGFTHHTQFIGKMWRPIEYIFNTPSHHRVHHGTNQRYLDKNYGEVFIVWDRLFGTFQEEDEPVRYGILRHPHSHSAWKINFHFWGLLWSDCLETKRWKDKFSVWFMPLGKRPQDVQSPRTPVRALEFGVPKSFKAKMHPRGYFLMGILVTTAIILMFSIISQKFELTNSMKVLFSLVLFYNVESWKSVLDFRETRFFHLYLSSLLVTGALYWVGKVDNIFDIKIAYFLITAQIVTLCQFQLENFVEKVSMKSN